MCSTKMVIKQHIRQSIVGTRKFAASAIHRFDLERGKKDGMCVGENLNRRFRNLLDGIPASVVC